MPAPDGLLIVDKPTGWTSHDVVNRGRRLAGTRKVGHAGTLDPMATGVLVLGIGRATRLLGHLALSTKGYDATVRFGQAMTTDDAEGEVLSEADASSIGRDQIVAVAADFVGDLLQVPSAVSAIKIDGERAYKRVRDGETVDIPARPVRVDSLDVSEVTQVGAFVDAVVHVECSSGTYIRALARDMGAKLGVGGHVTALRRTRVGAHGLDEAHPLEELTELDVDELPVMSMDDAARAHFPVFTVDDDHVAAVRNGRAIHARLSAASDERPSGAVAVFTPDGEFVALYEQHGPVAKAIAVFSPA